MNIAIIHGSVDAARAIEIAIRRSRHQLAWNERDPARALDTLATKERALADLVILDGAMRRPSSADTTRALLTAGVRVVLWVCSDEPSTATTYDAMASGAHALTHCPALDAAGELAQHEPLIAKLRSIGRLFGEATHPITETTRIAHGAELGPRLIAIGASTGGPQALSAILSALPRDLEASFVIVQHVDSTLVFELTSWLQTLTKLRVSVATPGARPETGAVLVAGYDEHLVMTPPGVFRYVSEPRDLTHRPSIDVLFASLATHWPKPGTAVLLTGMGRDGAQGLARLRTAGWQTLAQDESSSVVYGMPKAAVELKAVDSVLSLAEIAPALIRACRPRS